MFISKRGENDLSNKIKKFFSLPCCFKLQQLHNNNNNNNNNNNDIISILFFHHFPNIYGEKLNDKYYFGL